MIPASKDDSPDNPLHEYALSPKLIDILPARDISSLSIL